jgi:ADP-heptose:LPS heptosyltransferase
MGSTPAAEIERFKRRFAARRALEAAVGYSLRLPLSLVRFAVPGRNARPDRVLAVERILRIGDTLVTRPALAAIKEQYPGVELAVVCQPALQAVCRADPLVDFVIAAEAGLSGFLLAARAARAFGAATAYVLVPDRISPYLAWFGGAWRIIGYDYAVRNVALTDARRPPARANVPTFMYPENAPEIHASEIWLRLVDPEAPTPAAYPPFDVGEEARERVAAFLASRDAASNGSLVVLHTGAANESYLWNEDGWLEVARELRARGAGALAFKAGPAEESAASALAAKVGGPAAFAAALPLLETFALIAAADLVVSLDTAPVHIAATMGTPVVALYGPGDASMWRPLGVPYRAVEAEAPCRGCKSARCFQDKHYCMEAITPRAVVEAATELMTETRP